MKTDLVRVCKSQL